MQKVYRKATREWRVGKHKMWPDEAIRERGSSTRATDWERYVNAAGWGQATVIIGPQRFNRGEANSNYIIAYGQVIESMGCVQDATWWRA